MLVVYVKFSRYAFIEENRKRHNIKYKLYIKKYNTAYVYKVFIKV